MSQSLFPPIKNASNCSMPDAGLSWMQQSVQQFFSGFNWDNQPPQVQKGQLFDGLDENVVPSLQLTVNQFLSAIPWEGSPLSNLASSRLEDLPAPPAASFTLDDFSELF